MHGVAAALFWGLLAHLVGDYLIQSDWMAARKTKQWLPAVLHGVSYGLPFLVLLALFVPSGPGWVWRCALAWDVIVISHILIDHWRLARYLGWAKNQLAPRMWRHQWSSHVSGTGYHVVLPRGVTCGTDRLKEQEKPDFMAVWLMIITDNTVHIVINSLCIALTVGGR